jgi:YVTN family beta-propeller protein
VDSATVQPAAATYPATQYAVIKTIAVGLDPVGVAVNHADDTVYVANTLDRTLSIISGRTGAVIQTTSAFGAVGAYPENVAVHQQDDTVYVTSRNGNSVAVFNGRTNEQASDVIVGATPFGIAVHDDSIYVSTRGTTPPRVSVINARSLDDSLVVTSGFSTPSGIGINATDNKVYVANNGNSSVRVFDGVSGAGDDSISVGAGPLYAAVHQTDDTVYVTNFDGNSVSIVNGVTQSVFRTVTVGTKPWGVAVDQNSRAVFVAITSSDSVSILDGRSGDVDDTLAVGVNPAVVAIDDSGVNAGLVYVANYVSNDVSVIGRVTPTTPTTAGSAGDTVALTLDVPNLAAGYVMDAGTIEAVSFGANAGTSLARVAGQNQWTIVAPAGTAGSMVDINVRLKGGLWATAGTFTYGATPAVTSISPTSGSTVGGTSVTVTGTNFVAGASVAIGGVSCDDTSLTGSTQITCTTGARAAGVVDVVVTNPGPISGTGAGLFTYVAPAPTGDVLVSGNPVDPTITPLSISVAVGGTFTLSNTEATQTYFVRGVTGAVSIGGTPCTIDNVCTLSTLSTLTLTVVAQGTIRIGLGTLTIGSGSNPDPGPTPVPPGAPTGVTASPGNGQATISWSPPASFGSFAISTYMATASPDGRTCLVSAPALSCTISGLTNGVTYTFTVQALSGAGWSAASLSSNAITPSPLATPSILISGSRDGRDTRLVKVAGSTTGLAGERVTPWFRFPGQTTYTTGMGVRTVAPDGSFNWRRKTVKKIDVYFSHSTVVSNRIVIAAR